MTMPGQRIRAILGLAVARLRHDRTRTLLAVIGVTLAVLSVTLLGSLGVGVVDTGREKFDAADRDLWISGGPTRISPGTLGGFEGGIVNSHSVSQNLSERESINNAVPMLFQTVYVGSSEDSLETIVAVGTPSSGGVSLENGTGFAADSGFYNDGAYNGTPSHTLVVGPDLQTQFDVSVNESLHVGGTVVDAQRTQYTVTGTSSTFTQFLGTSTVALPLAELQAMTGNAHTDRASLITVDVTDSADVSVVAERLKAEYPEYTVRTNTEQLQAIVADRILVVAAGVVLIALAALAGIALTVNLLALLVYQEQDALAALRAVGVSRSTIVALVGVQGLFYGVIGAVVGLLVTLPAAMGLNYAASQIVGFDGLVQVTPEVLAAGAAVAIIAGFCSALVAGWRAAAVSPLAMLQR